MKVKRTLVPCSLALVILSILLMSVAGAAPGAADTTSLPRTAALTAPMTVRHTQPLNADAGSVIIKKDASAAAYSLTDPIVIDGVFTGALIDGDGTDTAGAGSAHPTKFVEQKKFDAADNVCYQDTNGSGQADAGDAYWLDDGDDNYDVGDAVIVGAPVLGAGARVDALAGETAIAYNDAEINDNNQYDDGEDIYLVDSESEFRGAMQRIVYDPLYPGSGQVLAHIYIANTTDTVFMHNDFIVDTESVWIDDGITNTVAGTQEAIGFQPFTNAISSTLNVQIFGRWFTTADDVYWKSTGWISDTWATGDSLWLDMDGNGVYDTGADLVLISTGVLNDGDVGRELNSDGLTPTYNFTYNDENGNGQWDIGEDISTLDGDEIYDWNYFDDRWSWLVDGDGDTTDGRGDEDLTRIDGNTWFQADDQVYHWDADTNGDWNEGDGLWVDTDSNGVFGASDSVLVRGTMTGGETGKLLQVALVDGDGDTTDGPGSENTARCGQTPFALTDHVFWYDVYDDDNWFWSSGDGLWIDDDGDTLFTDGVDRVLVRGSMTGGESGIRLTHGAHHFGYDDGEIDLNGQYDPGEDIYATNTYLAYDDFEVNFNGAYDSGEDVYDRDYIEIWVYAEGDTAQVPTDMYHPDLEPGLRDIGFRVHVNGIRVDDPTDDYDAPTGFQAAAGWGRSRGAQPMKDGGDYNRHYEYKLTSASASTQTHLVSNGTRVDVASPTAPNKPRVWETDHKIDWETCEITWITHWKDLRRGRDNYQGFGSSSGQREESIIVDWLHPPPPPPPEPLIVIKEPLFDTITPCPLGENFYCWSIFVYNPSDEPLGSIVLTDTLPEGWEGFVYYIETHPPGLPVVVGHAPDGRPVIQLPEGLPPGGWVEIIICGFGPIEPGAEEIINRVDGEMDDDGNPDTPPVPIPGDSSSVPVVPEPEVELFKIPDKTEVTAGGTVIWLIGVVNTGRLAVDNTSLKDGDQTLPLDTLGRGHVRIAGLQTEVSATLTPSTTLTNTLTLEGEFTTSAGATRSYSTSVSASVHVTAAVPMCTWEKSIWINDAGPYTPTAGPFDVAISDTVKIQDAVHCNFDWDGNLDDGWGSDYMGLNQTDSTWGDATHPSAGTLSWGITPTVPASTTIILTKTFHVTGTHLVSDTFTLDERLEVTGHDTVEQPVEFHWSRGYSWEKNIWINKRGPYAPEDGPFDVTVSDTIKIMDVVHCDSDCTGTLTETWPLTYTSLQQTDASSGTVAVTIKANQGTLSWHITPTVPTSRTVYLLKEFHIKDVPPFSDTFTLDEGLDISGYGSFDKPVTFHSKGKYTWDKKIWINDTGPHTPASGPFGVAVSDTVKIQDAVHRDSDWNGTLIERWASSQMQLQGKPEVSHGNIISTSDRLDWVISPTVPASTTVFLTKTFHISGEFLVSDAFYLHEWLQMPSYETSYKPIEFHVGDGYSWDKEWWFEGEATRYDPESDSASVVVSDTIKIRDVLHADSAWSGTLTETWPTAYVDLQSIKSSHGYTVTGSGKMNWVITPTVPTSTQVILTKTFHISATPLLTSDWFYVKESLDVPGYGTFDDRYDKRVDLRPTSGCSWDKEVWVNGGGPFDAGAATFKVVPSDTVKIREVLHSDFAWNGTLTETWPTAYMSLQSVEASSGTITTESGGMSWVITPTVPTSTQVILTKTFHISATPPVTETFLLDEHLDIPGHGDADKPVTFRASSSFGTLCVNEGPSVKGENLRRMLDQHIPVTKSHSALLIFTQCYGGNMVDNFRGRDKTGVASATSRGEEAIYGGYHSNASAGLRPGARRTSDDVHNGGVAGKNNDEHPIKAGETISLTPTSLTGTIKSRHVLVYAGKPGPLDVIDRINIQNNFANQHNTTVTTVGGSGGPGWDYPGTQAGLQQALAKIGRQMNSDEQFILFVTDHGDEHPEEKDVNAASSSKVRADVLVPASLVDDMNSTTENDDGTGVTLFSPGDTNFDPGDLVITLEGSTTEYTEFTDFSVDLDGDGNLNGPGEGHSLFFHIPELDLIPSVAEEDFVLGINIENQTPVDLFFSYVSMDSGSIPKGEPQPAVILEACVYLPLVLRDYQ